VDEFKSGVTEHHMAMSIAEKMEHLPIIGPSMKAAGRQSVAGELGFWMLWRLYGGDEGLRRYGFHPTTIHRKVSRFKETFGAHPDDFMLPGVEIDSQKYWQGSAAKVGAR
jgi:hypothetical protein